MIQRIKSVKTLSDYKLEIIFDDGRTVIYDVSEDMEDIPSHRQLRKSDTLYEYGKIIKE